MLDADVRKGRQVSHMRTKVDRGRGKTGTFFTEVLYIQPQTCKRNNKFEYTNPKLFHKVQATPRMTRFWQGTCMCVVRLNL